MLFLLPIVRESKVYMLENDTTTYFALENYKQRIEIHESYLLPLQNHKNNRRKRIYPNGKSGILFKRCSDSLIMIGLKRAYHRLTIKLLTIPRPVLSK